MVVNGNNRGGKPTRAYLCSYHRTRGNEVCPSTLRRPVEAIDSAVIDYLSANVLNDDVVDKTISLVKQHLLDRTHTTSTEVRELESEAKRLQSEIDNLVTASEPPRRLQRPSRRSYSAWRSEPALTSPASTAP